MVIPHALICMIGILNRILTVEMDAFKPPLLATGEADCELTKHML